MSKVALVLEGGGMKGAYTAGVIDCFIDNDIVFDACYGVSAGAINGCSYISLQKGRAINVLANHLEDKRMGSVRSLVKTGYYFDNDFLYDYIPNVLYPIDEETFSKSKTKLIVTVTNVETGKAEYFPINDIKEDMIYIRASSSLPIISRFVPIEDGYYLDGGLTDSIPIRKAQEDGFTKCVVVSTKHRGYKKKRTSSLNIVRVKYKRYPNLVKCIKERHIVYNKTMDYIYDEDKKGNCLLLQSSKEVKVKRLDKDKGKIMELYQQGYDETKAKIEMIKAYLK